MKKGLTLTDFAAKIERENKAKRDFIVSSPKIKTYANAGELELAFALKDQPATDADYFAGKLARTGHDQMAQYLNIPKAYYDRMLNPQNIDLLAKNAQWWLDRQSDRRMIDQKKLP